MSAAANKDFHKEEEEEEEEGSKRKPRTAVDVQRAKLERLMKNADKPVHLPTQRKEKDPNKAPEFVYNVMGSSAGAGSGEFHVYRQIRRKETLRQNVLQARKERDDLDEAYQQKLRENERQAEERTAKKRKKRQKKKERLKQKKQKNEKSQGEEKDSSSDSDG